MVAISLYRGNLHRVPPDVPRRWPMPAPGISLRDFNLLLRKRSLALSRPLLRTIHAPTPAPALVGGTKRPREEEEKAAAEEEEEGMGDNGGGCPHNLSSSAPTTPPPPPPNKELDIAGPHRVPPHTSTITALEKNAVVVVGGPHNESNVDENAAGGGNRATATTHVKMEISNSDTVNDKEDRKRELKQKLDILNEKKHHLVQMLKQILNAEEEMKKRISVQPSYMRPSAPLQVDAAVDAGSLTKHVSPRMGVEVHTRTSSASIGTIASPSRLALSGHQGQTTNLPPVSVSGTHFVPSSPSPAASGGTSSVFKDSRLTSPPWNSK